MAELRTPHSSRSSPSTSTILIFPSAYLQSIESNPDPAMEANGMDAISNETVDLVRFFFLLLPFHSLCLP
jgi:hypothetical protein